MNLEEIRRNYPQYNDMSDQELMGRLQAKQTQQQPASPQEDEMSFLDAATTGFKNIPESAVRFGRDMAQPFLHPVDTAKSLASLGKGAIELLIPGEQADEETAMAFGKFLKDRYGSWDAIKKTLAQDPVGMAADVSLVATGGAAAAGRLPGAVGRAAKTVGKAAKAIDPVIAAGRFAKAVGRGGGKFASQLVGGLGTHTGAESIQKAFTAGEKGSPDFLKNMRGEESMTSVLDESKNALANMRAERSNQYKIGSEAFKSSKKKLDFGPIDEALETTKASLKEGDKWKIGIDEQRKIKEVEGIVREWRRDIDSHTAGGLDALKQRLDAVYPDSPKHNQAQRVITNTRNAVKDLIVKEVPEYADTMAAYEQSIGLQKEIERALSLGDKASADTTLRKLQSLTRNNVNTNYGNRLELALELERQGAGTLMDKLSGQAMNDIAPRGLGKVVGGLNVGGAFYDPSLMMLLPFQSPRVVGEATYKMGQGSRLVKEMLRNMGVTPDRIRALEQGSFQSGRLHPALQELENKLQNR